MKLVPIRPQPGMYKNGTPYSRKLRWTDGNLVRWHDGSIRPVGGWVRRQTTAGVDVPALIVDPALEAIRDIFSWRDLGRSQNVVFFSNLNVTHLDNQNAVTDITPAGYTPINGSKDPAVTTGYGQGPYGLGAYGVENDFSGADLSPPDRWYSDNFGEVLLYGAINNGGIFEVSPGTLTPAAVANAPTNNRDLCVTDQRQVFVVGANGEPRRVQACDLEQRTEWTPQQANQAIDRTLAGSGQLLRCVKVLKQVLILGENDAHVARYIGPPYVYSIDLAANNCGPIAAQTVATTERFAVWWGERSFWLFDGSVQPIDCEVIDFLYKDYDASQVSKMQAFTNTDFTEVWWLYQSNSSTTGELDSYVMWDYVTRTWTTGRLNRTAGIDKTVTNTPILVNPDGEVFNHEIDTILPSEGATVFVETGAIELGNGDVNMGVQFIYPDAETVGALSYELITRQLPNATEYTFGPYAFQSSDPIPTTGAMGREVKLRVSALDAAAEIGTHRLDVVGIGTGKR